MTRQMTTDDMEALALKEEYYDDMFTRGALTGAGIDYAGDIIDYMSRLSGANLAQGLAERRIGRAKRLSDAAGRGAEARLAGVEARKGAAARQLAMQAGTQAAMDPTGSAAVEIAQKMPQVISEATDTSKELTTEMDAELKQKALAEGLRSKAEDEKLSAKHEKQKARFGLIKDTFESAGTLAATLKPPTYEKKQANIARRKQKQADRIEGRRQKTRDKIQPLLDKQAALRSRGENLSEEDQADLRNLMKKSQNQMKRRLRADTRARSARSNLEAVQAQELAELQAKHGSLFASTMTPNS